MDAREGAARFRTGPSPGHEVGTVKRDWLKTGCQSGLTWEGRVVDKLELVLRKVKAAHLLLGVVLVSFLAGCAGTSMGQQNPYLLTGAGLGAAGGAGLGVAASPNNPWRGAAIGGLLGTALGGVAGEAYGRSVAPSQPCYQSPPPRPYYQGPPPGYAPGPQGYAPAPQGYAPPPPGY
jgi:hypothetical protein